MVIGGEKKNIYVKDAKNVTFRSGGNKVQYCIMRVGQKYYNLEAVEGFEYHMERQGQVLNADATKIKENRILIGDENIYENVNQFIKGVKIRKDSCIAREMLLTTSPSFFKNISKEDFERWLTINVEWIKSTYGDTCIYCCLHMDESTPHLHLILSPVYTNTKGKRVMSNNHYFGGGRNGLIELQNNYSQYIQKTFKCLSRGLKGSRATHISIKQYYAMINKPLDEKNMESIKAKARENELTKITLNDTKKTLNVYKNNQDAKEIEKLKLEQQNNQMFDNLVQKKKNDELFKESMKTISKLYNIPQQDLLKIVGQCKEKSKEQEREK